jgi:hypothetical protein
MGTTQREGKDDFTDDEGRKEVIVVQKVMDGAMELEEGANVLGCRKGRCIGSWRRFGSAAHPA